MHRVDQKDTPLQGNTANVSRLLDRLFTMLNSEEVSYCILRNYEGFPDRIGNDVDMLVLPGHADLFEACILQAARETGWRLLKRPRRFGYRSYWFHYYKAGNEFVHFDAFTHIIWKGIPLADSHVILSNRKKRGQFYIPAPASEAGILFIKDLIQDGKIKSKYLQQIQETSVSYPDEFTEFLVYALGKSLGYSIYSQVRAGEWDKIEALKSQLRSGAFVTSLRRNPISTIAWIGLFLFGHLRALLARPNGFFITFIGPDGSGKTTISQGLMDSLSGLFPEILYFHGRLGTIRELRFFWNIVCRLTGRKPLPPAPSGTMAVHTIRPHSMLRAMIYITYYSIDYLLGYWVIKRAHSKGMLVIFDRYFYDYFIQDAFLRLPRMIFKPLLFILPRPDLVVYLQNSPEVIHKRKPELTTEQITKENEMCDLIASQLPYATTVSTAPPVREVIEKISAQALDIMVKRQIRSVTG